MSDPEYVATAPTRQARSSARDAPTCGPQSARVMMRRQGSTSSATASQEDTMYVRIVRAQAPPGQVEELARRWEAFWGVQMPQVPGFRHAHFAAGPETNATISISVWEQRPDAATMEPLMEQFREQVADISAGPPAFEEYETLADF